MAEQTTIRIVAITLPIGATIGYFVRICIEDKVIRRREKDKRHEDAYNVFAQAFNLALHSLEQKDEISYVIVYSGLPKHREAMLNFAHILQGGSKDSFRTKWTEFENKCKEIETHGKTITISDGLPGLIEFADDPEELQRDRDYKKELKKLIKELLTIAKER